MRSFSKWVLAGLLMLSINVSAVAGQGDDDQVLTLENFILFSPEDILKKANAGDPLAAYFMYQWHANGRYGFVLNTEMASYWRAKSVASFTQLAQQGDAQAQYGLWSIYEFDNTSSQEEKELGFQYLKMAVEQDYLPAMFGLVGVYDDGDKKDPELHQYWVKRATPYVIEGAEKGDPYLQIFLARLYKFGSVQIEQNDEQAAYWAQAGLKSMRELMQTAHPEKTYSDIWRQLYSIYSTSYGSFEGDPVKACILNGLALIAQEPRTGDLRALATGACDDARDLLGKEALRKLFRQCLNELTPECY